MPAITTKAIGMNIEPKADGTFLISYHVHTDDGRDFETRYLVVSWDTLTSFAPNLNGAILYEADRRVRNTAAGDCKTCGNLRMVQAKQPSGRMAADHCPDCWDRYANAEPSVPTFPSQSDG